MPVKPAIELERKKIGPKAKQHMGKLVAKFAETKPEDIISSLQENNKYDYSIDGDDTYHLIQKTLLVDFEAKEDFAVAKRDKYIVFISTARNREMMAKGLVKGHCKKTSDSKKRERIQPYRYFGNCINLRFR